MQVLPKAPSYPGVDVSQNVVLETSDGQAVVFPRSYAEVCHALPKAAPGVATGVAVSAPTMGIVYNYIAHYRSSWPPQLSVERPLRTDLRETLSEWDYEFYQNQLLVGGDPKKSDNIFLTLKAGQALGCDEVRDFACAALANIVKEVKDEADFYSLFAVDQPFTAKEKDKLYEDYEYRDTQKAAGAEDGEAGEEAPAA